MGINASEANYYRDMDFASGTIQHWYDAGFRHRDDITAGTTPVFPLTKLETGGEMASA